jgi:hypothetical protein
MKSDRNYDCQRAVGLLAYVYNRTGKKEDAAALFEQVTLTSTLSETQFNYACLLADQGRTEEARAWAQKIIAKKITMPRYLKRRERPWFRRAAGLLKRIPEAGNAGQKMASSTSRSA